MIEEQPDHLLAARRKAPPPPRAASVPAPPVRSDPETDRSRAVSCLQVRQLVFGAAPDLSLPMEGLMRRDRDEPAAQGGRLAKTRQFGEQLETHRLKNVGRILRTRAVFQRNRVNQVLVFGDEGRPGVLVAAQARADETSVAPRDVGAEEPSRAACVLLVSLRRTGRPPAPEQLLDVPKRVMVENSRPEVAQPLRRADEHAGTRRG